MTKALWSLLLVATLPGCLLAEPLDGAASDGNDTSGRAGSSSAGNSNSHAGASGDSGDSGDSSDSSDSGAPASGGSGATGGAPSTDRKTAPFLGIWTATAGMLTVSCSGTAPSNTDVTGNTETWLAGTTSDLEQDDFEGSCSFTANVTGRTAKASSGQSCTNGGTATDGDSYTQTFAFDSYAFVVSSDGTTATETLSGSDRYTDTTQNVTLQCPFTETATFEM